MRTDHEEARIWLLSSASGSSSLAPTSSCCALAETSCTTPGVCEAHHGDEEQEVTIGGIHVRCARVSCALTSCHQVRARSTDSAQSWAKWWL
jgi:hypothetical protein